MVLVVTVVLLMIIIIREICSQLDPNRGLYKRMEREIYGDEPAD